MGRISRGWKLAKLSLRVLRKDKEILLLPVLSAAVTIIILASFVAGLFVTSAFDAGFTVVWVVTAFAFYFVTYCVSIFFNAAIIGCATIRLNGGDPKVKDGLRIAFDNLGRIIAWALVAATVGMIIRAIQQRVGFVGKLIMGALGVAWTLVTYFVVPVLVYERLGPWAALKRSASLFKTTWGEMIVGNLGLGLIFVLVGFAGFVPIVLGVAVGGAAIVVGFIVAVVYWLVLAVVKTAAEGVLVAALYRYATTGQVPEGLEGVRFANPWSQ